MITQRINKWWKSSAKVPLALILIWAFLYIRWRPLRSQFSPSIPLKTHHTISLGIRSKVFSKSAKVEHKGCVTFLISTLLIYSLTLSLFNKQSTLLVASVWYKLFPSFTNCAQIHNVSRRFLFYFIFGLISSRPNLFLFVFR